MIAANIVGHISAEPRTFDLRNSGTGCELRITISRQDFDDDGVPFSRDRKVKAVTYDARLAQVIARDYKTGDFVQLLADDIRVERAWKNNQGNWISGSAVFVMAKIRKVTAVTPEEQPAGNPRAENATARAEASVLDGVRVSDHPAAAEPELAAAAS
jgi:hypothetical protein